MTLPAKIAKKLKSIHILTKLSIRAYDSEGNHLKEYTSNNQSFRIQNISLEILNERPMILLRYLILRKIFIYQMLA